MVHNPLASPPSTSASGSNWGGVAGSTSYTGSSSAAGLLEDDGPPSYDSIRSDMPIPDPHHTRRPVAQLSPIVQALFTPPPNPEPMITRARASNLPDIQVKRVSRRLESWDPKLNDPHVLYDFIRSQALTPPRVSIRCRSSHSEVAAMKQTVLVDGMMREVHPGQKFTVTDFDFTIDLSPVFAHEDNLANVHIQCKRGQVPAHRGSHWRTFGPDVDLAYADTPTQRFGRKASWKENRLWDAWARFARERGRAPWADMEGDEEFRTSLTSAAGGGRVQLGSEESGASIAPDEERLIMSNDPTNDTPLREWVGAYCADRGLLKSFTISKVVWGWDLVTLKSAIERAVLSTGYLPDPQGRGIEVDYDFGDEAQVTVRPDNFLVKILYTPAWFILLLCFVVVYPIIWVWSRLSVRAGGPYEVAVASWGMKWYAPLPNTFPNEDVEAARHRLPSMFKLHPQISPHVYLQEGPKGVHYLVGRREGEWFREWEERIRMAVRMRYQGQLTDTRVNVDGDVPPELDGY